MNYKNLLLVRMGCLNAILGTLAAYVGRPHAAMLWADPTYITHSIGVVGAAGLGYALWRGYWLTRALDAARGARVWLNADALAFENQKLQLAQRMSGVGYAASMCVLLGLAGTVVGFMIALSGVEPSAVGSATAIGPMVAKLLDGMAVALNTTIVGLAANIWLSLNERILRAGVMHALNKRVQ